MRVARDDHEKQKEATEDVAVSEQIDDRIAQLDATVLRSMSRRRAASIEAGRAFNELKKLLAHGEWEHHFAETFAPHGISLRTAERYMRRAKREEAISKNDKLSILKPADDQGAQEIKNANNDARLEVDMASTQKQPPRHIYRLPLRLTIEEKEAADVLQTLPEWSSAERRIVSLLKKVCVKHRVIKNNTRRQS